MLNQTTLPKKPMETHDPSASCSGPISLAVTRFFSAPADRVFDSWLDGASVGRWLFATPDGQMQRVEIAPCPGGKFLIVEKRGAELAGHFGTYDIIERPRRLAFSFATIRQPTPTRVTVEIEPVAAGCKLTLTHALSREWIALQEKVQAGWTMILEGLGAKALGERPFLISRDFDTPRERLWAAWTDPAQMEWWGPKGAAVLHPKLDFHPGGLFHYALRTSEGLNFWGRWIILEIARPGRLVFLNSFSDEAGGITRHPGIPDWPLEILTTVTFDSQAAGMRLTVCWLPVNATETERNVFDASHHLMKDGWNGSLDRLVEHLAKT
jgi:uncharacterized protein YndB with AHSA1/START domain